MSGDVKAGDCLGQSNHKIVEFCILGDIRRMNSKTAILNFQRADFEQFRTLAQRVPWDSVLKGKGVQEGWLLLKKEVLKAQEQAIPLCRKMNWWERRLPWMNRAFPEAPGEKENFPPVEEGMDNLRRVQRIC